MALSDELQATIKAYRAEESRKFKEGRFEDRLVDMCKTDSDLRQKARAAQLQTEKMIGDRADARVRAGEVLPEHDVWLEAEAARQCLIIALVESGGDVGVAQEHTQRRMQLTATAEEFFAPEEPSANPAP